MKNRDFKIDFKIVCLLVIGTILLTIIGIVAEIQHWEFYQVIRKTGLMLFFSTWVIIVSDMAKHKIYNKTFWLLSMFIIPPITPIIYMIQRKRLIRLGHKLP